MDIVIGQPRHRSRRREAAAAMFALGLTIGVILGALLSGGVSKADAPPHRPVTPDERCDALPGERCECWVAPW